MMLKRFFIYWFGLVILSVCPGATAWATAGLDINLVSGSTGMEMQASLFGTPMNESDPRPPGLTYDIQSCPGVVNTDTQKCFVAAVTNTSGAAIPKEIGVMFPEFRGVFPIAGAPEESEVRMGFGVVNPFEGALNFRQEYAGGLYQRNSIRWVDYGTYDKGLSIFQDRWGSEAEQTNVPRASLVIDRYAPNRMRMGWRHPIELAPGATWVSDQFWFTAHRGGWAKGIESYGQYVNGKLQIAENRRFVPIPEHVRDGVGYRTVWMHEGVAHECGSERHFTLADLSGSLATEAREYGLEEIVLFGGILYTQAPLIHDRRLGTYNALVTKIRDLRALGTGNRVNVSLFFNVNNKKLSDYQLGLPWPDNGCRFIAPGDPDFSGPFSFDRFENFWTYSTNFAPSIEAPFKPSTEHPVQHQNFSAGYYTNSAIANLNQSINSWSSAGAPSFTMDESDDDGTGDLYNLLGAGRSAREAGAGNGFYRPTFGGEPYYGNFERAHRLLDYTWGWVDYLEAGPYLSTIKYPRIGANVSRSPRTIKMAFVDGLYLNVMPAKPNLANGSGRINDGDPAFNSVRAALKTAKNFRANFISYYTAGKFLGDSILNDAPMINGIRKPFLRKDKGNHVGGATIELPKAEAAEAFVRAHLSADGSKMIIFLMNNGPVANARIQIAANLHHWLQGAPTGFQRRSFKESASDVPPTRDDSACDFGTPPAAGAPWNIISKPLQQGELVVCEIGLLL